MDIGSGSRGSITPMRYGGGLEFQIDVETEFSGLFGQLADRIISALSRGSSWLNVTLGAIPRVMSPLLIICGGYNSGRCVALSSWIGIAPSLWILTWIMAEANPVFSNLLSLTVRFVLFSSLFLSSSHYQLQPTALFATGPSP
ncbi:hypothetical protein BDV28DRAFT_150011 [Aspergillus coremiiformis]|uniref:Uncharacterized protein n=1 Tax=Aspergillus coremiiformis TaxID=138285 RepID=A0A5N6Z1U3_9EURO|nr:hypothetical protein BDV28DRAFT_150011 [Aspergillus coremiiformis]